jgi:hypothetical protein
MLRIGYAQSVPDEGSLSIDRPYPSPVRDASHRGHPLRQAIIRDLTCGEWPPYSLVLGALGFCAGVAFAWCKLLNASDTGRMDGQLRATLALWRAALSQ